MRAEAAAGEETTIKWKNAGFSLIEVIISMAVLAVVTIPLLSYFTDSMRHSAKMAVRQKGTTLAQDITEGLKAEDSVLEKLTDGGGNVYYGVKSLESDGYTVKSGETPIDINDGTGNITYLADKERYHVEVTVSTSVPANAKTRPITYGIDNICDVLAVENEQSEQAVSYFMSINSANFVLDNTVTLLTETQVRDNMTRVMYIDITYTPGATSPYYVETYYIYSCTGLNSSNPVIYSTEKELLTDIYMTQLKSIYLLYQKVGELDDELVVTSNITLPENPVLYLVCQNPAETTSYKLNVTKLAIDQRIRSNISENGGSSKYGGVYSRNSSGNLDTAYATGISEAGNPVRLVEITTTVYEVNDSGDYTAETPIISVTTTKGD